MTTANALSDVVIGERNWRNRKRLTVADLAMSWEVNRAGSLSCRVPIADLTAAGWSRTLIGAWIRYDHPTAGSFGGVVTSVQYSDGIADIGAQSFHVLTRKRLIRAGDEDDRPASGTPGGLFQRFLRSAGATRTGEADRLLLNIGTVDTGGDTIEVSFTDEDLYETVIPTLTTDVGYQWSVDADREVTFGKRLGRVLTPTVKLTEGVEITSSRWSDDLWMIDNTIIAYGVATVTRKQRRAYYRVSSTAVNTASVDAFGALQAVRDYGNVDSERSLQQLAAIEVGDTAVPDAAVELTVADVGGCWSLFREGDTIAIDLPLVGISADVTIAVRALDVTSGTMVVAGTGVRT